jgi:hypothetical protein
MSENKFDELQKLYDNSRIGSLVQEICEYFATKDGYEDNSYQDEIEPPEIVESVYLLFCLQSRERILDEFAIVQKKYPDLYQSVSGMHNTLLINMDYRALEKECGSKIASYVKDTSSEQVISQVDSCSRSSENLSEALDKFYTWLHSRRKD